MFCLPEAESFLALIRPKESQNCPHDGTFPTAHLAELCGGLNLNIIVKCPQSIHITGKQGQLTPVAEPDMGYGGLAPSNGSLSPPYHKHTDQELCEIFKF